MATRVALALLLVVAALAATTTDASACSCASGDPRRMLAAAEAAFVGTLVERPSGSFTNSGELATYVFEVEHAVKGRLGETIEVLRAELPGGRAQSDARLPGQSVSALEAVS